MMQEVFALTIKEVLSSHESTEIVFEEAGYAPMRVSEEYVSRQNPQPGGCCVVLRDGYTSFSPA